MLAEAFEDVQSLNVSTMPQRSGRFLKTEGEESDARQWSLITNLGEEIVGGMECRCSYMMPYIVNALSSPLPQANQILIAMSLYTDFFGRVEHFL